MRKILSFLLCLLLLAGIPALYAQAAENTVSAQGTCGEGLTWTLTEDGTLTVFGEGAMEDYTSAESAPWKDCKDNILTIVTEAGVTRIGNYAFSGCAALTSVSTGADIGDGAFRDCGSLAEVTLLEGTTTIGEDAFGYCSSLEKITFPKSLKAIGDWSCFYGANALREAHISDAGAWSQVAIGGSYACPMYFGAKLYLNGEEITELVIPEGITQLGDYTFYNCTGITSVTLPSTLVSIQENTFSGCTGIEKVCISDLASWCEAELGTSRGNPLYYAGTLYLNGELVAQAAIPDGVSKIGSGAFYGCKDIVSATIPDSVTSIGDSAFSGCAGLTEITLGNSIAGIGSSAFSNCTQLKTLTLPDSVRTIGQFAFYKCAALTQIQLPDGITSVEREVFAGCTSLSQIQLPRTLETIESNAFQKCAIENIVIPEKVTSIKSYAFSQCASLGKLFFLGNEPEAVENNSFSGCSADARIYYPENAEGWGTDTWQGLPAESWNYEKTSTATCTQAGVETITSAEHDLTYTRTVLPLGHVFENWYVQTQPTADTVGLWGCICENCDAVDTKEIPKLVATEQSPAKTGNEGGLEYDSYSDRFPYQPYSANLVSSYLMADPNGGYIRVEDAGDHVTVEWYDEGFTFLSRRGLEVELSFFAGFHNDGTYNYLIFASEISSADVPMFRVVKYSQDFCRISSVDIYRSNGAYPCDAGSLRVASQGNYLYAATCFDSGHQFSFWFAVNTKTMEVLGMSHGAASHSFNQFVQIEGDQVYIVDQGDTYPRAIQLFPYTVRPGGSLLGGSKNALQVMEFTSAGSDHYNYTGCELGGYEITESSHIIAGKSIDQDGTVSRRTGQRNVFISVTNKASLSSTPVWLTDYADGSEVSVSVPQLVKISDGQLCILWTEGTTLRYAFINSAGEIIGEIYSTEGALSDCKPIVADNKICWYVTQNSEPIFYTIDLSAPETVTQIHRHSYTYSLTKAPTEDTEGTLTGVCAFCKETETVVLPTITEQDYTSEIVTKPDCTTAGSCRYTWNDTTYGPVEFETELPALGHTETVAEGTAPSCTADGLSAGTRCAVCGEILVPQETVPALGHSWDEGRVTKEPTEWTEGTKTYTCTTCGDTRAETLAALGHTHQYADVVTPPTCTSKGYTTHTCTCGHSYEDSYVDMVPHTEVIDEALEASCEKTGLTEGKHCAACGTVLVKQEVIPAKGHRYESGVCSTCGAKDPDWTEPTEPVPTEPEVTEPEVTEPEVTEPEVTEPEVTEPEVTEPEVTEPEVTEPEVTEPEVTEPEVTEPEVTEPEVTEPEVTEPEVTEPEVTEPEVTEPEVTEPEVTEPEVTEPEVTEPEPSEPEIIRIAGGNRFETALLVADQMKANLGVEKLDAIIVASGSNFADALSGSYLAAVKNAPILLSFNDKYNELAKDYIWENLIPGGTVYILGGPAAVPESMEEGLDNFNIIRLAGNDRFGTNLAILEEAGVEDKDILVCTGLSFADSLSASASKLPILLVWKNLTDEQKAFLDSMDGNKLYIIGGESAVSEKMEKQVTVYGKTARIGGNNRFETSVLIAETFFESPGAAVLAYAWNYPDGLCGGALASTLDAPLILTMTNYEAQAAEYIQCQEVLKGTILGGTGLISEESAEMIFAAPEQK